MPGQVKDKRPTLIALYRNLTELGRDPNGVTKDVLVDRKLRFPEQLKDKFYKAVTQKCKDFRQEYDNLFYSKKDYTNFPYYKNNQYVKKYIEDYPEFNGNPVALILYLGKGKIKGTKPVGKSVFYYASLIIGFDGESGLPIEAQKCAVEVFTPIEKGEEHWLDTFSKALSKFDAKKFNGKKILINECKDSVKTTATASAERKFKFKDGSVITASTAEEAKAKHKVIASKRINIRKHNTISDDEKEFRITWRSEIFIKAKSKAEAERKFEELGLFSADALDLGAEWVETNSVEDKSTL